MNSKNLYCPSCGVDVKPISTYVGEKKVWKCPNCGLIIDEEEAITLQSRKLNKVLVAEDSKSVAGLIKKLLENKKYAKEVELTLNGVQFLSSATKIFKAGGELDLVILDVEMPALNGVQAALSFRDLEKRAGRKKKIPILFFTSKTAGEKFKVILRKLEPSSYVNKGASQDPMELMNRMEKVIKILLTMS